MRGTVFAEEAVVGVSVSWAVFPEGPTPDGALFYPGYEGWMTLQYEMVAQGLVYEADHLYQDVPDWDDFDVPDDPEGTAEFRAWEEACEPILWARDPKPEGLPWHKLDSGDGHVLTPSEIDVALARASTTPVTLEGDRLTRFWREWLDFLGRAAAEGGGARVDVGVQPGWLSHIPSEWKQERAPGAVD
jgi:hypothetical protein